MKVFASNVFHIYNRGNNKQLIFFSEENYFFFLFKLKKHIGPHCEILAYCLMPNHFHLLIYTDEHFDRHEFSKAFGIALRSYTRAINKQEQRTGSLFQQNSRSKQIVNAGSGNYILTCFNYIHLNPYKAGLVKKIEDWPHSSIGEYLNTYPSGIKLCNRDLCRRFIDLPEEPLLIIQQTYVYLSDGITIVMPSLK